MSPGYKATELYITALCIVAAVALCLANKIDGNAAIAAIGVLGTGYTGSRTLIKKATADTPIVVRSTRTPRGK